jgi:hypothetical protein
MEAAIKKLGLGGWGLQPWGGDVRVVGCQGYKPNLRVVKIMYKPNLVSATLRRTTCI